jgi:hypothetical protein
MDEFVDQTKTLVGALGWDIFRIVQSSASEATSRVALVADTEVANAPRFFFRGDGFDASMTIGVAGDYVVTKNSKARIRPTPTIPKGAKALRQMLQEQGILQLHDGSLLFTSNYSFQSPSAAAAVVTAASANGRILWKLASGLTYSDWEAGQNQDH